MHAYLNAMMLGVATGSPHALHAMISRIAAGYPLIGVIDPDSNERSPDGIQGDYEERRRVRGTSY